MAFLRLSKEATKYILKTEKEEYWNKRIAKLEKEIAELQAIPPENRDNDRLTEKQDELSTVKDAARSVMDKLAFYGPTIWTIKSVSQIVIDKIMKDMNSPIAKIRGKGKDEISSQQVSYTREMSREICKRGVTGWSNLRNPDEIDPETKEHKLIDFSPELVEILPYEITSELSNQISGNVDEDEILNLS